MPHSTREPARGAHWCRAALAAAALLASGARAQQALPYVSPPLHFMTEVREPNATGPIKAPLPPADRSASCDAACLTGFAAAYLDALARRDYRALPVAGNLMVTENGHPTRLGNNVWRVIEKMNAPSAYFTDPVQGQVVALTTIEESAHQPLIYIVRLKIDDRKIADVEQIVIQDIDGGQHFRPDLVGSFGASATAELPADQRSTRAALLDAVHAYWYRGGKLSDGSALGRSGCIHSENADVLPGFGCDPGRSPETESLFTTRNLRDAIVDPARGIVITFGLEDTSPFLNPDPPDIERTPIFYRRPQTNVVMQVFKFRQGKVMAASAIFMDFQEAGLPALFPRDGNGPSGPPPANPPAAGR